MGLSRNKVAVSEGAAGSPPFYGEPLFEEKSRDGGHTEVWSDEKVLLIEKPKKEGEIFEDEYLLLFNFQGLFGPHRRHGGVAQLGEHLPCKQGVMGSNPIISTTSGKKPKPHIGS